MVRMTQLPNNARFSHVTDWVFDLDNTLYPHHSNLFSQIDLRMTAYVSELLSLPRDEARKLQQQLQQDKSYTRLGELEHVTLPDLERRLSAAESAARTAGALAAEAVLHEEGVARTLAVWTGIPVAKMLEGEADKLMKMEERLGQRVSTGPDWLAVEPQPIRPALVHTYQDHRMAMSFSVLGAVRAGIQIEDPACVAKTYPGFFTDLAAAYRAAGAPAPW